MLARLQQLTTLGLVLAAVAWAAYFVHIDSPVWALGGAMLILLGYALVLALEFVLLRFINRGDPAPRASLRQLLGALWGEVLSAPRVFCWRQPFRSHAVPDHLPAGANRRGVVLVHGFVCNRALWNPMMLRLRALGVPFIAVNLEPVFGSIDDYPAILEAAVARLAECTGQPPLIVAHSMGGLALRAWWCEHAGDERAHHAVTIATPHRGTFLARFALTANARQMRIGSAWQRALASREPAQRYRRFTCFYGHCDNIVFPASNATLPGADNRHVAGCAHVHMAHHDEVFNEVLSRLGSNAASPRAASPSDAMPAR